MSKAQNAIYYLWGCRFIHYQFLGQFIWKENRFTQKRLTLARFQTLTALAA
ncbi:hypothetical protein AQAU111925_09240 [Aquirufa aurantiipilula]